jgi:dTDP-4-dehydrorhamnose reductase
MILVLGASGYVGSAYQRFLAGRGITFQAADRRKHDYLQKDGLRRLIEEVQPEFVINAAGYTGKPNVDACEIHKTECLEGNGVFPGLVKEVCAETETPWGHVSSGCIFTGSRPDGSGFREEDAPNFSFRQNNCSFYSGTKALGEEILQDASQCYIWRLRIPFDHIDNPRNYMSKVMTYARLLEARNSLSQLDDFVRVTWECWSRRLPVGTYNVTNPGSITTHEVVELIKKSALSKRLQAKGKEFSFFTDEAEFMKIAAKTPRSNCVLDSSKITGLGIKMDEVHEAVERALARWESKS